ncbi:MAG: TonB-system energizer ExbB, partial [Nitrospiraceae bacterium]
MNRGLEMDTLKEPVDYGAIGLLLALSLWAVAIAVERWFFYCRIDVSQFPNQQVFEMALTKR